MALEISPIDCCLLPPTLCLIARLKQGSNCSRLVVVIIVVVVVVVGGVLTY